jgi:hypothetical protein
MTNNIEKLNAKLNAYSQFSIDNKACPTKTETNLDGIMVYICGKIDEIIDVVNELIDKSYFHQGEWLNSVVDRIKELENYKSKLEQKKQIDDITIKGKIVKDEGVKISEELLEESLEDQLNKLEKGCWYFAEIRVGDIWLNHVFEFKYLNHVHVNYACLICIDGCNKGSIVWDDFIYDIQIDAKSIKKLSEEL